MFSKTTAMSFDSRERLSRSRIIHVHFTMEKSQPQPLVAEPELQKIAGDPKAAPRKWPLDYSGNANWPSTWKVCVITAALVWGCRPPTETVYSPWAMTGSPASVTMLRSRGPKSK